MKPVLDRRVLLTGGAGFIGSSLAAILLDAGYQVLVLDLLTYASSKRSVAAMMDHPRFSFVQADIADAAAVDEIFSRFQPTAVMHLAAETHVDRSIDGPAAFLNTNVMGTFTLLQAARAHHDALTGEAAEAFRFHHVSTDEVFGALDDTGRFDESTNYDPRSPYSASKAASDHFVRAWGHTYGLPILVTNCSNNYGPRQHPEKLIPLLITRALERADLPLYGAGDQVRDWLYVDDHAHGLKRVLEAGATGRTYVLGGSSERTNLQVAEAVCACLDILAARGDGSAHAAAIRFVEDRPGHDQRYAIDAGRIDQELGWRPRLSFKDGIERTVSWYLANSDWWKPLVEAAGTTRRGVARHELDRT